MQWLIAPTVIRPLADGSRVSGSWKTAMVTVALVLPVVVVLLPPAQASSRARRALPLSAVPPSARAAFKKRRRERWFSPPSAAKALTGRERSGAAPGLGHVHE